MNDITLPQIQISKLIDEMDLSVPVRYRHGLYGHNTRITAVYKGYDSIHINIIGDGMPQQEVIICVRKQQAIFFPPVAVLPENENYQLDLKTVLISVFATIRECLSEILLTPPFLSLTRSSNLATFSVYSLRDGNCKEICYTTQVTLASKFFRSSQLLDSN